MGTSAARKAPRGGAWRPAKAAATRFFSGDSPGALPARELVSRYLAALKNTPPIWEGGLPAAFSHTRKAALELGNFWEEGLAAGTLPTADPTLKALKLADAWLPADGSLGTACTRTALVSILHEFLANPAQDSGNPSPAAVVREFLIRATVMRLYLDLGEALEAAAPDAAALEAAQAAFALAVAEALVLPPVPPPGCWLKLAGWTWVTRALEGQGKAGIRGAP